MPRANVTYRADIDGLRAFSILAVIGFHAFPNVVPGGFVGVDVFFVISGYLISDIIFTELKEGTFSFADFYVRRAKRIFPALLLVLVVVWAVGWRDMIAADFARLGEEIAAGASYMSNVFLFWNQAGYFNGPASQKPLIHLWSLSVEEQFYLLFPFAIFLAWKKRLNLLLCISTIGVLSFVSNIVLVSDHRSAAFYLPHNRFWEIMIGGVLAYLGVFWAMPSRSGRASSNVCAGFGFALILAAVFVLDPKKQLPGWWALMPTVGAAFLIFAGQDAWVNRKVLSHKLFVFVGLISYPLYLWHWPILSFARMMQDKEPGGIALTALIAFAFLLAWLTYEFIEKPIRFGRLPIPSWRVATILAGFALLVMTPGGIFTSIADGFPTRFPRALQWSRTNQKETNVAYRPDCFLGAENEEPAFPDECVDKSDEAEPLLVIWGDSHAADLYPGFHALQRHYRFRLAQFTVSSCPPLLKVEIAAAPYCKQSNDKTFDRIADLRPDGVILSALWSGLDQYQIDWSSLNDTVAALKSAGVRRVLVVGPVPTWSGEGLPECLQQYYVRHRTVPFKMKYGLEIFSDLDQALRERSRMAGALYVSMIDLLCEDGECLTRLGDRADEIVAFDYGHLTIAGSRYLVGRFPHRLFGDASSASRRNEPSEDLPPPN